MVDREAKKEKRLGGSGVCALSIHDQRFTIHDSRRKKPLTPVPIPDIRDRLEWLYINVFTANWVVKSEGLPPLASGSMLSEGHLGKSDGGVELQANSGGILIKEGWVSRNVIRHSRTGDSGATIRSASVRSGSSAHQVNNS